jgi:hypothetical protein
MICFYRLVCLAVCFMDDFDISIHRPVNILVFCFTVLDLKSYVRLFCIFLL